MSISAMNIIFPQGRISIWSDGLCVLYGPIDKMAIALLEYSTREANGALKITYNSCIEIDLQKGTIQWIGINYCKPYQWELLEKEIPRIWKLKSFW